MKAYKTVSTRKTVQTKPAIGKNQVENSAGGFVFAVDDWTRLDRFLVLGSEGGTYYVSEKKLTKDNAGCVARCIQAHGVRVVNRIVEISEAGRAPKNDPALFALAMCAGLGNDETKKAAFAALPKVARIGTHLFHFASYVEQFRGWGRGLTRSIKNWYDSKPVDKVAYDVIKYQSRDGWAHRDLLRLAHPRTDDMQRNAIYKWIVDTEITDGLHEIVRAFESAKKAQTAKEIIALVREHSLPRECIPTQHLNDASVWEALLEKMPMTAMIRNLATMTRVGLLAPMSSAVAKIESALSNQDVITKARVHPIAVLAALKTYQQGHGERGKNTWNPVSQIVDALNGAFYLAFKTIEPTGKRWLLALDVSGSMGGGAIAGIPGLTPRDASAAMSLVTAATEKQYHIMGFSSRFIPLSISPRQRLDDAIRNISGLPFEGTDCALPMIWAMENNVQVDSFVVYTDNETWAGDIHPFQALQQYRQKTGIPAKLIVVGMTATDFSIADPNDAGMMDVVGFDTATPQIIADMAKS